MFPFDLSVAATPAGVPRKKKIEMEHDMARYASYFHKGDPAYNASTYTPRDPNEKKTAPDIPTESVNPQRILTATHDKSAIFYLLQVNTHPPKLLLGLPSCFLSTPVVLYSVPLPSSVLLSPSSRLRVWKNARLLRLMKRIYGIMRRSEWRNLDLQSR